MINMEIIGFGATDEVGRSCFLLRDKDRSILLDAGLKIIPKQPSQAPDGVDKFAKDINAIVVSHAHVDHSGYVPALFKHGFNGQVHMTQPTREISYVLWNDHFKIEGNRHWDFENLEETMHNTRDHLYKRKFKLADGIYATFYNAGHILGSAITLIDWDGTLIVYTGDINDQSTPLFDGFELPGDEPIDILITEDTHGVKDVPAREEVNKAFKRDVLHTLQKGRKVLVPAFAIGRSQEIQFLLGEFLHDYPVYIDGMIKKMNMITNYYLRKEWVSPKVFKYLKDHGIFNPFTRENFFEIDRSMYSNTYDFRYQLGDEKDPFLILSTSGMLEGGPIHTHLEVHGAEPENLLAITGYQAEGTIGRSILDGAKEITINEHFNKPKTIPINLQLKTYRFSGHTSPAGIKHLINETKPREIFLVHSDASNTKDAVKFLSNGVAPKTLKRKKPIKIRV